MVKEQRMYVILDKELEGRAGCPVMERLPFGKLFDRKINRPSLSLNSIWDVSFNGNCPYTRLNWEGVFLPTNYYLLKKGGRNQDEKIFLPWG